MKTKNNKDGKHFDMEHAVQEWRRNLRRMGALQDGDFLELEGYLRDKIEECLEQGLGEEPAFQKAAAEFTDISKLDGDYYRARSTSRFGGEPPWQPTRFSPALMWNTFKVAARKLKRQKVYSLIMTAGLTAAMAAFLLIFLYCRFERSYDGFHRNGSRIYRVQNDRISASRHDRSAGCPPGLAAALKAEFPEVMDSVRLFNVSGDFNVVSSTPGSRGNEKSGTAGRVVSFYEKNVFFADPSFLRIFTFPLVRGDEETALEDPDAAVLTESAARKYFGKDDPLGRSVSVTTRFGQQDYRVKGVCRDLPPNSHLRFDLLLSFSSLEILWPSLKNQLWSSNGFLTYLMLSPTAEPGSLEAKFPGLIESYPLQSESFRREFHLQPLSSIHLTSRLRFEAGINGELKTVVFLEIIGFFILVIAWANFINLATARSLQRGKEVCVRKTLGAEKNQLVRQFLIESVLLNALAFVLALSVVQAVLPTFNSLVGKSLTFSLLGSGWIFLILSILAGALLAGAYPAFILSSFHPVAALRGSIRGESKGSGLRKALVLLQFTLAVILIAATLIVGKQMAFIRSQDLGVDIQHTMVFKVPPMESPWQTLLLARNRLSSLAPVSNAAVSSSIPGREYSNAVGSVRQGAPREEGQTVFIVDTDDRYFQFYDIPFCAGRAFSEGMLSDRTSVILNEEAVKFLGFESAEKAVLQNIMVFGDQLQIIGVVENYHHKSLRDKIEPVVFWPFPASIFPGVNYLSLKTQGTSVKASIEAVENLWGELFPGQPFEYFFLDDDFNAQYDEDMKFGRIFGWASFLAILIACLGLFGLASYSAERRISEIGIRKVFGASISGITAMLAGEFVRWVLLANLIAWPLTVIIMNRWLNRFAYRTTIDVWTLGVSAFLTLFIALATVSCKAVSAATANPVESIRNE